MWKRVKHARAGSWLKTTSHGPRRTVHVSGRQLMGQEDLSFYPPQQTSAGDGGLADSYGGQGIFTGGIQTGKGLSA